MKTKSAGKFYGVGVGPGDPELLTLRAVRVLEKVDIVIAPSAGGDSIAFEIAKPYIKGKLLKMPFEMGACGRARQEALDKNADLIRRMLLEGNDTAFITLGDPMTYSTFIYMTERLTDFEIEVIPGVTSFSAAAAKLLMPVAEGRKPFAVVPAGDREILEKALENFDNVVVMKVSSDYGGVLDLLEQKGFRSGLVVRCGHRDEVVTLEPEKYRGQKIDYLSVIIGKKVKP
ncbi:precorrin-2 C(20)-methyltransferase [Thermosediminibacter oceani]|uniref:Precorrin-2 C20-methyltransferase n=1 Tax=Thermosediminibacter oceani (strain ATCC BAA-1034 / DSM 16646 / JW/IW-1228P) TaxID=555079 RepID=D9S0T1_THEOJ|nr:precorrin-2 C(20)-methyltransferase [Thermosediminibacter oceani]ADL07095.1 precorrin-2 C20-methyltransferase [Thermosediminibacter oceani DSM 16646]